MNTYEKLPLLSKLHEVFTRGLFKLIQKVTIKF